MIPHHRHPSLSKHFWGVELAIPIHIHLSRVTLHQLTRVMHHTSAIILFLKLLLPVDRSQFLQFDLLKSPYTMNPREGGL